MANISGQVTSQTSGRSDFHGTKVIPLGLFPLVLRRPVGSSLEGVPAAVRDRWIMSLMATCLTCQPSLDLQLRPCNPREGTSAPQCRQKCGAQIVVSRSSPTATLSELSSNLRPSDETEKACSQAPEVLSLAAIAAWLSLCNPRLHSTGTQSP